MCKSFIEKGFTRTSRVLLLFALSLSLSLFFMQFVDILFYIIIVCDLVLVIFRLQSMLSAVHILLTICFLHCKVNPSRTVHRGWFFSIECNYRVHAFLQGERSGQQQQKTQILIIYL